MLTREAGVIRWRRVNLRLAVGVVGAALALTLLPACGGNNVSPQPASATSAAATSATPSTTTSATLAPTPAPATPTPTVPGANAIADINAQTKARPPAAEVLQAMREAARLHGALVAPDCVPGRGCVAAQDAAPYDRGVMRLGITDGMGGAVLIMGKDKTGTWKEWFGTQNITYRLLELPGDMLVCAEGDSLNLRTEPDPGAKILALLPPLAKVRAEQFVLTEAATFVPGSSQVVGSGWYRLSSPQAGWASSKFLSDARLNDCTIRDQTERR